MNKFLVVANWKANTPKFQFENLPTPDIEVAIAPPHSSISSIPKEFTRASQDCSQFQSGAYTGEVTASMLKSLDVKYCLIGHSERRKHLHETNIEIEKKLEQLIKNGITAIICAQTLEEIPTNYRNFSPEKYVVMYEPSTAISIEGHYQPEQPEKVKVVLESWKTKLPSGVRFLYGGSISPDNVQSYLEPRTYNLITGFVIGHASLDPKPFFEITKQCQKQIIS